MTLFKTNIYTSIATATKLLVAFILNKLIAVYLGPEGLSILGQGKTISTLFQTAATGGISTGVVAQIAKSSNDLEKQKIVSNSIIISTIFSLILGLALMMFYKRISILAFGNENFSIFFYMLIISLFPFAMNALILSIFNGLRYVKEITVVSILSNILGFFTTFILVVIFGLMGGLVALALNQAVVVIISLKYAFEKVSFLRYISCQFSWEVCSTLLKYSTVTIINIAISPLSLIIIRKMLISNTSLLVAGYWEGVWQLSGMYLSFVTALLSIYFLPKFSSSNTHRELNFELMSGLKALGGISFVLLLIIYIFRKIIILILFSSSFLPAADLFLVHLAGDFMKILSWLYAYIFLAKTKVFITVVTASFTQMLFVLLTYILLPYYSINAVTTSYFITYVLYFFTLVCIYKFMLKKKLLV